LNDSPIKSQEKEAQRMLDFKRGKFFIESFLSKNELKKP
jgi:hypothetical protein